MDINTLLLELAVILVIAKLLEEVIIRFGFPPILGDLLAGLILGPTMLNVIIVSGELEFLAWLGVIVLLFMAGLETKYSDFKRYCFTAAVVGIGGVIASFGLGFIMGILLGYNYVTSAFLGAILTATSISITVKTLMDLGRMDSEESVLVIEAAVLDDIYGLFVLALVYSLALGRLFNIIDILIGVLGVVFIVLMVITMHKLNMVVHRFLLKLKFSEAPTIFVLSFGILVAAITGHLKLSPIVGAFMLGLALSDMPIAALINEKLSLLNYLFAPVFFVYAGLLLNPWGTSWSISAVIVALLIVLVGIASKIIGCAVPAVLLGVKLRQALAVGVGMIPRGEVALIISVAGLSLNVIPQEIYLGTLLLIYTSSILAPLLLKLIYSTKS
ncbi:MAG TPA: cation:proton antiporter [Desulfurococcales archaeon]|nr:cation:proton antiporter [Desulfurococcales archaeon]